MSYLGTTATAVATALTTTALILPALLSLSPTSAYRILLQSNVVWNSELKRLSSKSSSPSEVLLANGQDAPRGTAAAAERGAEEDTLTNPSWLADLFVSLMKTSLTCKRLLDCQRYCAFVAIQHALDCSENMSQMKEDLFERTSMDVALSEAEAENLLKYFDLAVLAGGCAHVGNKVRSSNLATKVRQLSLQDRLRGTGYKVIQHVVATSPATASHFVVVHYEKKEVLLSISYDSIGGLTRLVRSSVDVQRQVLPSRRGIDEQQHQAREDLLLAAKKISEETFHMIQHIFIPNGHRVVVCVLG